MNNAIIEVNNLVKQFKNSLAVNNLSFKINKGTIIGLLGPNGCGKTTTMGMMLGLIKPTSGAVFINGQNIENEKNRTNILEKMNFISPYIELPKKLTVEENLKVYGRMYGVNNLEDKISDLMKQLNLFDFKKRKTGELSSGQKNRVSLAKALINDPEILLLDEPTGGLDVTSARRVRDLVRKLGDEGRTVIYSTHQLNEAQQVCDRIVIIHNGTLRADGSPTKLMEQTGTDSLEDAFVELTQDESREVETPEPESKFQQFWSRLTTGKKQPPSGESPQNGGEVDA